MPLSNSLKRDDSFLVKAAVGAALVGAGIAAYVVVKRWRGNSTGKPATDKKATSGPADSRQTTTDKATVLPKPPSSSDGASSKPVLPPPAGTTGPASKPGPASSSPSSVTQPPRQDPHTTPASQPADSSHSALRDASKPPAAGAATPAAAGGSTAAGGSAAGISSPRDTPVIPTRPKDETKLVQGSQEGGASSLRDAPTARPSAPVPDSGRSLNTSQTTPTRPGGQRDDNNDLSTSSTFEKVPVGGNSLTLSGTSFGPSTPPATGGQPSMSPRSTPQAGGPSSAGSASLDSSIGSQGYSMLHDFDPKTPPRAPRSDGP